MSQAASIDFDHLLRAALALSAEDRARLVEALIATPEVEGRAPFHESWAGEIRRRTAEFDARLVQPIPWEVVQERARRRVMDHD